MQLHPSVEALLDEAIQVRRALHRIPELAYQERKTQAFILSYLQKLEPDSIEKLADTGVKAVFYAERPAGTVAFRADMDALNVKEATGLEYASYSGRMHACGHDGHMTVLLLLAKLIAQSRKSLFQNVVLLFQPAEEGFAGAKRMIEDGALNDPPVERIFGLHIWPQVPEGKVAVRWGPMMAKTCEFDIVVGGVSAHGASPQLGADAVVSAAAFISLLQTAITRNLDPHQDAILTIGKIAGGTARNIIADRVEMNATLRVFSQKVFDQLMNRLRAMADGMALSTGTKFEIAELMHYPCVDNPRYLVEDFYQYVDEEDRMIAEPVMAAEDFSFYQEEIPGLFFFLGAGTPKYSQPLHNNRFDFDERILLSGLEIYRRMLCL